MTKMLKQAETCVVNEFADLRSSEENFFQSRSLNVIHKSWPKIVQRVNDEIQNSFHDHLEPVVNFGFLADFGPGLGSKNKTHDDIGYGRPKISGRKGIKKETKRKSHKSQMLLS